MENKVLEVFERDYSNEVANWEEDVTSVLKEIPRVEGRLEDYLKWYAKK